MTVATAEYRTEEDILQAFLDEKCDLSPEYTIEKDTLFLKWKLWCENSGETEAGRQSKRWLTRRMTARGFEHAGSGRSQLAGLQMALRAGPDPEL